jgi:hypothetical protein
VATHPIGINAIAARTVNIFLFDRFIELSKLFSGLAVVTFALGAFGLW